MKILLIATNRQDRYMNRMMVQPLPLGVAYLASHVDPHRHTLQVLDLMFVEEYLAAAETAIRTFLPDLIGLSVRNLDNQSYLNPESMLSLVKRLVEHLRSLTSATIVCGGPAFSILPRECFDFLNPDLGIVGDAEETFAHLADRLAEGVDIRDIPGLVWREGEGVVVQEARAVAAFSKPPRLDLLDISRYRQAGFGIGVITKLSPFHDPAGKRPAEASWRVRPTSEVLEEVNRLKERFGLRRIFFIDSGFNIPLSYAKELCQALYDSKLGVRWNTYLRPGSCDAALIQLMQQSGCGLVLLAGTQGYGEGGTLDAHLDQLEQLCRLCEAGGLPYTLSLTFAEPGESRATVEQKLSFLRARRPSFATLRIGVRILPHTSVARLALEEGRIQAESQLLHPTFYLAEAVSPWIVAHLHAAAAENPRWGLM